MTSQPYLTPEDAAKGQVPGWELNLKDSHKRNGREGKQTKKQLRRLKMFAEDSGHAASRHKTKYC